MAEEAQRRRVADGGILCVLALRASQLWDFVDNRDIDKHAASMAILAGTAKVTLWAMGFAEAHPDNSALTIAAVVAPYMALQAAAIGWYFNTRS